jgi:4-hydroxyphenylacetate 3-monooxygenase
MAARTGSEFLQRLSAARVHVEIGGETLTGGVAAHPAFRNVVASYADLYDMQHDPAYRDILTYPSPTTGDPVATSFLVPETPEDLAKRSQAFKLWADRSLGMLGRTPDYLNSALMALSAAHDWFGQANPAWGENIRRYVEKVREEDLLCTHTLVPPQANRAVAASQQARGELMAHVVREDDNGVVIRGARLLATIGPFADELLVFPSTVLRATPEDKPYSFACAIPNDSDGLRYLARESLDYGRDRHDHPLGSRFEEPDAVVIFDDVHVPYERVFVLGDPDLCNGFYSHTSAVVHMTHQVLARTTVHPRPGQPAHRGHRHRAVPACPGRPGRGHHHAGDAARAGPGRRGRRRPERLRRAHPGLAAAEHGPQPVPEALPAVPRDPA